MEHGSFQERNLDKVDNYEGIFKGRGKFFGDISKNSLTKGKHRNGDDKGISDRLKNERTKALETLQKTQKDDIFKRPLPVKNREIPIISVDVSPNNPSMQLNHTDYVAFRRANTINISDLVTDETINLESSSRLLSASKDAHVLFEPTEITGRSTLNKEYKKKHKNTVEEECEAVRDDVCKTNNISISEILASSFAPKARYLSETFNDGDIVLNSGECRDHAMPLSASTSFSSFNSSRSLPRTADMSLSKRSCTEESFFGRCGTFSLNTAETGADLYEKEHFAPADLMQSKLINDEISWAQEYAAIPAATLSEQAKAKALKSSGIDYNPFDSPTTSNSMIAGGPNCSVGSFFNMRSDSIKNIVKSKSPDKSRMPVALVNGGDNTVTSTSSDLESSSEISVTPKIDNKTYMSLGTFLTHKEKKMSLPRPSVLLNHESKDSGNSTDNSYLLSISAIDRALYNLEIQSDTSGIGVSEQLLKQGKSSKSCTNPYNKSNKSENSKTSFYPKGKSAETDIKNKECEKTIAVEEMILENKENLDPKNTRNSGASALCDTMSFSESILNSSDMKNLQRSISQPRSPLSPIDVIAPNIQINQIPDIGEEADDDEWPATPIAENRRVRLRKSPRDKSPLQNKTSNNDSSGETTPVKSVRSNAHSLKNKSFEPKSMSSTRLDGGERCSNADRDFGISPNNSKGHPCKTSLMVAKNTLCVPQAKSPTVASPSRLVNSPIGSPMRSQTPTSREFQSPNLDATSNSDRQLLGAGSARKIVSSPAGSESSSTYACGTIQACPSGISAASGRSESRCSSSSEFSHRDGKQIPLKVTNTELSWASIKLRNDSIKSMQIKNTVNKRLVIRVEISGPGFQIVNSHRSNTITLQPQECRTINISFCPTVRGVAVGKLSFYAPSSAQTTTSCLLDVPLYGYGGTARIIFQNVLNGPVGSPFITMGFVRELIKPLEQTISFYNKGPLLGFVYLTIDSTGLLIPRLNDAFEIYPSKFLIPPKNMVHVRVVFRPKRNEIKKIITKSNGVLTLSTLRVFCGDEATRQRTRRLVSKMSEEERSKLFTPSTRGLWTDFPQESEMYDLCDIKEYSSVAFDLVSSVQVHEILLTINHDNMDDTVETSSFMADMDETVLFRTICAAADSPTPSSNLSTVDELFDEGDAEHIKSTKQGFWSVSPQILHINLNNQAPITLCVHNEFKSRQFFEVVCNIKGLFHFTPSDGYVAPDGGQTQIDISLHANFQYPSEKVYIMVYMENERIMVPVNIKK